MKSWSLVAAAAVAWGLSGCGGGGGGVATTNGVGFSQLVTFGDSLSDIGAYRVGTVAAVGGGRFTVNSPTAKNWTELIAAQYGLPTPCPAQTGLPSVLFPGFTGAAVQTFPNCRNYAQGSARVTSPVGPSSLALQQAVYAAYGGAANAPASTQAAASTAGLGMTAVPVVTQMNNHLSVVGGAYSGTELVTVAAGANDVFINLNGVASAAAGGSSAAFNAALAGWPASVQAAVAAGGAGAVNAAQQAAVQSMAQAATDLATDIKTLVLGKGAKYVALVNVPDVSKTPFAVGANVASPGTAALISTLVTTFNSTLQSAMAGVKGVTYIDVYTQLQAQVANPAQYGLTNVTTPACSTTSTANPLAGSSLTCTAASTIAGDTSHYEFADSVHPTPYGYQLFAQYVSLQLASAGWQ